MPAAVLTTSGRIAIATAIKARTAHLAWGSGDPTWTSTPPDPPANTSALLAEVGRRKAVQVEFCTPDAAGAVVVPEGTFTITTTPTNNLYYRFHWDFADGAGSTIREMAIYIDTVAAAGVPIGQFYLLPAQVAQPGILLTAERRAPLVREAYSRPMLEYVVTF
jgi:hypothetical protein